MYQTIRGDNVTLIPCSAERSARTANHKTPVRRQYGRLTDADSARVCVTVVAHRTPFGGMASE
jgi:NADPH-dependent ferric siderophore reductase